MKKTSILFAVIAVCILFCSSSAEARRHKYKEIEVEVGTGVFKTQTIQEEGKPPKIIKKEIMKKVTKYVDEYGHEFTEEEYKQKRREEPEDVPAAENPALSTGQAFNPFENLFTKFGAGFSTRYFYLVSEYQTSLISSLVSSRWDKSITFEGYGWDMYLSAGEFVQLHNGIKLSLAFFRMDKAINSFTEGAFSATESASSSIIMLRADYYYHLVDMFYVSGGAGICYQSLTTSLATNLTTNLTSYAYSGLEGNVLMATIEFGTGIKLGITSGINLNLGAELIIFLRDKGTSAPALTCGVSPSAGISAVW